MKTILITLVLFAMITLSISGCGVSHSRFDAVSDSLKVALVKADSLQAANTTLNASLTAANAKVDSLTALTTKHVHVKKATTVTKGAKTVVTKHTKKVAVKATGSVVK